MARYLLWGLHDVWEVVIVGPLGPGPVLLRVELAGPGSGPLSCVADDAEFLIHSPMGL